MPVSMNALKNKINNIPEETVMKAVLSMKSMGQKLVLEEGKGFEGKKIRI